MNEASNADKIRHMFDHLPWLKIPKNYYEYSSDMVLTMEFFDGGQINDLEYFNKNRLDKHDVALILLLELKFL
jgi:aarF domain-containing kinase